MKALDSDLPFLHSVCKPSGVFNPYSAESIVDAVTKYEQSGGCVSELTVFNHIDELIDILTGKNR